MKRGIILEIEESEYKKWKSRMLELGYDSLEEYIECLVEQDMIHDFCYNEGNEK